MSDSCESHRPLRFERIVIGCSLLVIAFSSAVQGQGFLPETRAVEYRGTITAINPAAEVVSIQTDQGVIFANFSAVRRTSDGILIGGLPPVTTTVIGYDTPRVLQRRMFIQFRATVRNRREVIGEVRSIAVVDALPENGFRRIGPARLGGPRGIDDDAAEADDEAIDREEIGGRLVGEMGAVPPPPPGGRGVPVDDPGNASGVIEIPLDGRPDVGAGGLVDRAAEDDDEEGTIEELWVFGMIGSVRRNRLTINVPTDDGRQQMSLELGDDTVVRMETNDFSQASVGDVIHLLGEAVELPRVFATQATAIHLTDELVDAAPNRIAGLLEDNAFAIDEDGLLAGDPIDPAGDDEMAEGADGERVDPFAVVDQERRDRENERAGENAADRAGADGKIFHGRILRIN